MTGGASNEQKGPTMDRPQVWTLNRKSSTRRGVLCYGAEVEAAEPKLPLTAVQPGQNTKHPKQKTRMG